MQTKNNYEEIILKELKTLPVDTIPEIINFVQSLRKSVGYHENATTTSMEPTGLCGKWKDNRSAPEIIDDIYSHRTGFGTRHTDI